MQHPVHDVVVNQFSRSLKALKGILLKARSHAEARKFDENLYLQMRVAPDMFPLVRQVQITSDSAKFAAARLTGKQAPPFPDEEKTLADLVTRIDRTIEFISGMKPADFANYATTNQEFQFRPGVSMTGYDYFASHVLPNFYFHMTTTYNLLRSCGVEIGKNDFLGEQNWKKK